MDLVDISGDLANPDFDEKVRLQMSPNRGLPPVSAQKYQNLQKDS